MLYEGKKNERAIPFVVFMKGSSVCLLVCFYSCLLKI